ncbi:MAG: hypothetical protein WAL42_01450, partial [Nitrososphaeraceae archaeon]
GYCTPSSAVTMNIANPSPNSAQPTTIGNSFNKTVAIQQNESEHDIGKLLSTDVGLDIICTIPCYCDIQFSRREFLTVLKYPDHPFAKRIESLVEDNRLR